jgi:hypothetical protein
LTSAELSREVVSGLAPISRLNRHGRGKSESAALLKVGSGAAAADGFAGLGRLLWPVGGAGRIGAGSGG